MSSPKEFKVKQSKEKIIEQAAEELARIFVAQIDEQLHRQKKEADG